MSQHNQNLGDKGESIASDFLEENNYKIIERNWRNSYQEIDLIALDKNTLVFVEVKTRNSNKFGTPESAITTNKQKQLFKAAEAYIEQEKVEFSDLRFDVISIQISEKKIKEVKHFKDAFYSNWH
jgi:putative endonuclease